MEFEDVILSHPHDFFRYKRLGVVPGTCFVLMPFAKEFDLVYDTVEASLRGLMLCTRADDLRLGKPILERILRGIATAELIIADLTGRNPNVFYELALAHTRTKDVLLLTQSIDDVPFDLRQLFCHVYSIHSKSGLDELAAIVRESATEIASKRLPQTIDGTLARTKRIVDYMRQLLESQDKCQGLVIRVQASISSLGNIGRSDSKDPNERKYGMYLEEERELMIQLVERGALLQCILSPRTLALDFGTAMEHISARFDRVLSFLRRNDDSIERCQFVVTPAIGPNVLFLGEEIIFEGHKTGVEGGFGWTMVFTDPDLIKTRISIFDRLFESARHYTLEMYGETMGEEDESSCLIRAVIKALDAARQKQILSDEGSGV
jgi:hypothetical protein